MTVCNFFLQGRCRYGDKCWNEHPRGGRGGDYRGNQPPNRGGFGNRVWVNPSQRSGNDFSQSSSSSRDGGNWNRRDVKSSEFSFGSNQNRFSALNSQNNTEKSGQTTVDDNKEHVDTIQKEMEIWQSSGQWPFSCYSVLTVQISGFVELSPEELRLEYYNSRASGDLQTYVNSVQQLANQWKNRVQELKMMNRSTQISVISELNTSGQTSSSNQFGSSGFGSASASGFGSTAASGFGSTPASGFGSTPASGFGSSAASGFGSTSGSGFGSASGSGFGSTPASGFESKPASGFGSTPTSGFGTGGFGSGSPSVNNFSFAPSGGGFGSVNTQQTSGFANTSIAKSSSAASFSFTSSSVENKPNTASFGWSSGPFQSASSGSSGGVVSGFGSSAAGGGGVGDSGNKEDKVFTARSDLTDEELKEFTAKRFTLGRIPLKPPPVDLLMV